MENVPESTRNVETLTECEAMEDETPQNCDNFSDIDACQNEVQINNLGGPISNWAQASNDISYDTYDDNTNTQPEYWPSETQVQIFNAKQGLFDWWNTINGPTDVIAFDCECVQVPIHIGTPDESYSKNKQQCALLSIVDFEERNLLDIRVRYRFDSFIVNKYTKRINGIRKHDLQNGFTLNEAAYLLRRACLLPPHRRRVAHSRWRIVVTWGEQELTYLPTPENIRHVDLQSYYTQCSICRQEVGSVPLDCGHRRQRLSLAAVIWHEFNVDIQSGIHDPRIDAQYTMKLFREKFLPLVRETNGHFKLNYIIDRRPRRNIG